MPPESSPQQRVFLEKYPIRAVLGVPLVVEDRLIGGVSVVRFTVDREFSELDEALVVTCARRIAAALDFRKSIVQPDLQL